jgi:hypothetical protein
MWSGTLISIRGRDGRRSICEVVAVVQIGDMDGGDGVTVCIMRISIHRAGWGLNIVWALLQLRDKHEWKQAES